VNEHLLHDRVLALWSLDYTPLRTSLRQIADLLVPGGVLLATTYGPGFEEEHAAMHPAFKHFPHHEPEVIEDTALKNGFDAVTVKPFDCPFTEGRDAEWHSRHLLRSMAHPVQDEPDARFWLIEAQTVTA